MELLDALRLLMEVSMVSYAMMLFFFVVYIMLGKM